MSERDGAGGDLRAQIQKAGLRDVATPRADAPRLILPERADRLVGILGAMGAWICEFDGDGHLAYSSTNAEEILGFTPDELIELEIEFHPDDLPSVVETSRQVRTTGEMAQNEVRIRHKDGHWVWLETSVLGWHGASEGDFHTVAVSRDISELKRLQAARDESDARYRVVSEMSCDLIFELDVEGRITYVGPGSLELIGYTPEEALATEPWSLIHAQDVEKLRELLESEFRIPSEKRLTEDVRGRKPIMEHRVRHRDGRWMWFETLGLTYKRADGAIRYLAVGRDVTKRKLAERERRELEDSMQRAQKLESLGVLAGGIAHDFNNILTPIMGAAGLARRDLPEDSPVCAQLDRIQRGVVRAAALTNQMLAYAGQKPLRSAHVDLSLLVVEMRELVASSISGKTTFELDLEPDLPAVEAETAQLSQVVMNLVTNAAEALEDGAGGVQIRTGSVYLEAPPSGALFSETMAPGQHVYLEVEDEGCGMEPGTLERIFDPFFTTKFTGRGLGLAAVAGIVRAHRGAIVVDSEPGRGTRFQVLLPVTTEARGAPVQRQPFPAGWRTTGTALVIDDDDAIRELAEDVLRRCGMNVLTAADGHEGVKVFAEHVDSIRVILLDRTMPALSGIDTCEAIRQIRKDAKIVLVSGYSKERVTAELAGQGLAGFLTKPFTPEALLEVIRSALGEDA